MQKNTYDYIVVGAGAAGCAVANRLSEDPAVKVLLLEAGGRDLNPWIHIPVGYGKTFVNPAVNWVYTSEPDEGTGGERRIRQHRGGRVRVGERREGQPRGGQSVDGERRPGSGRVG